MKIGKDVLEWDFMHLPLSDFNAILGMDGLSHYRANVDYFEKNVIFKKENGRRICFLGENKKVSTNFQL